MTISTFITGNMNNLSSSSYFCLHTDCLHTISNYNKLTSIIYKRYNALWLDFSFSIVTYMQL